MINSRALLIIFIALLSLGYLGYELIDIQIVNHEYYKHLAERQQNRLMSLKANRGIIKDCKGEVLAFTKDDISLLADVRMLDGKERALIADSFANVFHKSKAHYLSLFNNAKGNISLAKKIVRKKAILLKDLVVDGLFIKEDYTRIYPYGSLASHIIGFVNKQCTGVSGLEKQYDEYLTGRDGLLAIERDVRGRIVSIDDELSVPAIPGNVIHLTINKIYQKILETELREGVKEYKGNSAVGIIMDPNTGEILALANVPDYDPANYNLFPNENRRNRTVTDTYEPGSTMKSITMAILLDNDLVREDELVNTENGSYKIYKTRITDTHKFKFLTAREILEQSSNVGITKLSDRIDANTFYKYLRDFGFGNTTSIDLPGEVSGSLKKPSKFSALSKPFMSFGYEISVTPLQMTTAFAALVNGGLLMQPYVVKSISTYDGKILKKFEPQEIRRVVSEQSSNKIREFMIDVVENGTGKEAKLSKIIIGGKTGTSQKLISKRYSKEHYNASFIGFFPADNPNIVCFILIQSPEVGLYGGKVAAPIFRKVAEKIIKADLDLIPVENKPDEKKESLERLISDVKINSKSSEYLIASDIGEEKKPLFTNSKQTIKRNTMPDLKNYSVRDAVALISEIGLKYQIIGNGTVVSQSIEPGSYYEKGSLCLLNCESSQKLKSLRIN